LSQVSRPIPNTADKQVVIDTIEKLNKDIISSRYKNNSRAKIGINKSC